MSEEASRLRAGLEQLLIDWRETLSFSRGVVSDESKESGVRVLAVCIDKLDLLLRAVPPALEAAPAPRMDPRNADHRLGCPALHRTDYVCDCGMSIRVGSTATASAQAQPAPPDGLADVIDQAGWAVAQCKGHGRIIEALQARIAALEDGQ